MSDSTSGAPRVVITGMGWITPLGHDLETVWSRLAACESGAVCECVAANTIWAAGIPVFSDARRRTTTDRSLAIPIKSQATKAACSVSLRNTIALAFSGSRVPVALRSK